MSRICRECRKGTLEITGMGAYEDTILVQCPECGEEYELEPDGFGEGGIELVEAFEIEQKRREQEEKEDANDGG
jgi:RNase P subunit RPR2